jgi:putative oxidoreductase
MDFACCFTGQLYLEIIVVHGIKKIGFEVGVEVVPNPFGILRSINEILAITDNLVFPQLIILGLFTKFAILPILAVALTGYFIAYTNTH